MTKESSFEGPQMGSSKDHQEQYTGRMLVDRDGTPYPELTEKFSPKLEGTDREEGNIKNSGLGINVHPEIG